VSSKTSHLKRLLRLLPWVIAVVYAAVSGVSHPSFRLTFFGDTAQLSLITLLVASFAANALATEERARWFWYWMTVGCGFWMASQAVWSYYELWRHLPPPDPSLGGVLLFLHLAPMTAALVVMPHKRSGIPPLTALSMGMIFTWWLFIYAYLVLPWQYVIPAPELYSQAFNSLYTIEDVVFIGLLALLANNSRGAWRKLYVGLLGGSVLYAVGTVAVNHVITQKRYYTGSLYDMFFLLPVAWLAFVAADFRADDSADLQESTPRNHGREGWLTFLALLSVPCLLVLNALSDVPSSVQRFRSIAGLGAIVVLSLLVFAKQYVLAGRLAESLAISEWNVSELLQLREQLEQKATHDSMTGLLNRSTTIMSLERELARSLREGGRVAALLLDLDHFKAINDRYGHHAGDTAIAFAATCMEQSVRQHDYVGRYGGEEFLIVISDCDQDLAMEIAERIRTRMDSEVISVDGRGLEISATLGLAISEHGESSESLLRRADGALYAGKQRGRNVVVCASEVLQSFD
jgi:diguanylate cyclase (GGDEF)-like protein